MTDRIVSVDDSYNLPDKVNIRDVNLPDNLQPAALSATYVGKELKRAYCQLDHPSSMVDAGGPGEITIRREFMVPVEPTRFRVHLRNRNFLSDADSTTALTALNVFIGEHKIDTLAGDGHKQDPPPTNRQNGGFKS